MSFAPVLCLLLGSPEPTWLTDYDPAVERALKEKKDLVILFQENGELEDAMKGTDVRKRLEKFICLKIPVTYKYEGNALLEHEALRDMVGKPGLTIISYHDDKLPTHGYVISAHPFVGSRYRWAPRYGVEEVKLILDLPAFATLSQRSMIYAVSVHPERPQSVYCQLHPAMLQHAQSHSRRQAGAHRLHHANLSAAISIIGSQMGVGLGGASEVVAESGGRVVGGESVLEAAFGSVDGWRGSPGHWSAVSRPHRYYGYDIARGANGTWYATGIFAR